MAELTVEDMRLSAGATEVTQAIALERDNVVKYEIRLTALQSSATGGFTASLQGSDDLENWRTESSYDLASASSVPSVNYVPAAGVGDSLAWRYVRLKLTNGFDKRVLLSVSIRTHVRYY